MVGGRDVVQVLNSSAFHDTSLVRSGDLAYLGESWSKTIGCALIPLVRTGLMSTRKESEKTLKEQVELLMIVEKEIKGKKFFEGNNIGFLDIVALIVAYWIPCLQDVANKEVLKREKYPWIYSWTDELLGCNVTKQHLPDMEKMKSFYRALIAEKNAKTSLKFFSKT